LEINSKTKTLLMTQNADGLFSNVDWQRKIFSGRWSNSLGGQHKVIEPATGTPLATVGVANAEDVAKSAASAKVAQTQWANRAPQERAAVLRRAADLFGRHQNEIARWLVREAGGTRAKSEFEILQTINFSIEAAAIASQPPGLVLPSAFPRISLATRVPRGVIGIISPFNFPLLLSMRATAPALSLGNAVVLKPDLRTPVAGGLIIARVLEEAGLPEGLLHVLPGAGETGQALCQDPNIAMISFTGSTGTGRKVAELAGKYLKKVTLELGGKNSILILDDADLDLAASNVAWGAWLHQGQICMAAGRVLVHEKLATGLVQRLVERANRLPVGNPDTEEVALGPLIDRRQLEKVDAIVQESIQKGAALRAGGTHKDLFYSATVLENVSPRMRAFREEIFGPVACVTTFNSDEQAIALASDTEYGLSAGVISSSVERALTIARQIPVGMAHINDQSVDDEPAVPFGGIGASGNGSRHGGPANWDEFTEWRWITIQNKPHPYPF
jgi:benzaldehyde dehydrogenase (NAD)